MRALLFLTVFIFSSPLKSAYAGKKTGAQGLGLFKKKEQRKSPAIAAQGEAPKLKLFQGLFKGKDVEMEAPEKLAKPIGPNPKSRETVENPPYKHAMIFSGGSLDIYGFFGMYDAAVASGNPPDLIIGTCGGALAAAIIKAMPDPEERRAFIRSKQFYNYMRNIKFTDMPLTGILKDLKTIAHLAVEQRDPSSPHRVVPLARYKRSVLHKDNEYYYDEIDVSFEKQSVEAPEVVIISNELLYDKEDAKRRVAAGEKLYRETVYSSEKVKGQLEKMNYSSATGAALPNSFIGTRVALRTDVSLTQAARNSFTDPYLIHLDQNYLTGAVNSRSSYKIASLAKELSVRYPPHWDKIDGGMMSKFFGYDPWEETENYTSLYADRWIDTSSPQYESMSQKIAFVPTIGSLPSLGFRAVSGVPKFSHDNFKDNVEEQYAYGWSEYSKSDSLPKNDKTHIDKRIDRGLPASEFKAMQAEARK
ncbi:hypothetical protein GW915_05595 [bacterium]|nr:hypothetical protein [bacterium]